MRHFYQTLIPDTYPAPATLPSTGGGGGGVTTNGALRLPCDTVASALLQLLVAVLACLARNNPTLNASDASAERMSSSGRDAFTTRANDIVRCASVFAVQLYVELGFGVTYYRNVESGVCLLVPCYVV